LSNFTVNEQVRDKVNQAGFEYCKEFNETGWWHSIDLGNGLITPGVRKLEQLRENYARFKLPDDLTGKRVLDIGCWDGFYSFEAERRGAEVVAVDRFHPEKFFEAHHLLNSRVEFHKMSVYQLSPETLGTFDIVFFLGVLYHLRHPLFALEKVCSVTSGFAIIESQVIDGMLSIPTPVMEFYEMDELAGQYDNWWRPNSLCLTKLTNSAGFVDIETLNCSEIHTTLKAHRQWLKNETGAIDSIQILGMINGVNYSQIYPNRGYGAFLQIWAKGLAQEIGRDRVRITVGNYGTQPIHIGHPNNSSDEIVSIITCPIPPGLPEGKAKVQVFCEQQKSNEAEIDLSAGNDWDCA
jgi:tRNA (mo5U34)-methyltransferase